MRYENDLVVFTAGRQDSVPATLNISESDSATPDVFAVDILKLTQTSATDVTNFLKGSAGQLLRIVGNSNITIKDNANIKTADGNDRVLKNDVVYTFTYADNVWYENESYVPPPPDPPPPTPVYVVEVTSSAGSSVTVTDETTTIAFIASSGTFTVDTINGGYNGQRISFIHASISAGLIIDNSGNINLWAGTLTPTTYDSIILTRYDGFWYASP